MHRRQRTASVLEAKTSRRGPEGSSRGAPDLRAAEPKSKPFAPAVIRDITEEDVRRTLTHLTPAVIRYVHPPRALGQQPTYEVQRGFNPAPRIVKWDEKLDHCRDLGGGDGTVDGILDSKNKGGGRLKQDPKTNEVVPEQLPSLPAFWSGVPDLMGPEGHAEGGPGKERVL